MGTYHPRTVLVATRCGSTPPCIDIHWIGITPMIQYSKEFDAYYEDTTNEWIDSRCCDPSCGYCSNRPKKPMHFTNTDNPIDFPPVENDLVYRLNKRAEIRRQITTRKSVQENQPDRIADLLEEAAQRIAILERNIAMMKEEKDGK